MEYFINTDGSCRLDLHKAGASCIILTKKKFIHTECMAIASSYALEAELCGIVMALKYMYNNVDLTEEDSITFSVDSVKAIKLCNAIMNGYVVEEFNVPFFDYVKDTLEDILRTGANVIFKKVKAHKDNFNTNKVADRLSKVAIAYMPLKAWCV